VAQDKTIYFIKLSGSDKFWKAKIFL